MKKNMSNDEKRVPEVVVGYSEELEKIMQNPDLLMEDEYRDGWDDGEKNNVHRHSSSHYHSHHHSSSSHHSSRTHHTSSGSGRLASHHRSRHHHHHHSETNNQETVVSVPSDTITSDAGEYSYSENFEDTVATEEMRTNHEDTAVTYDLSPSVKKDFSEFDNGISEVSYPAADRTRRIASKASGSESSKREAERKTKNSKRKGIRNSNRRDRKRKKKIGFFGVIVRILIFFIAIGIAAVGTLVYMRARGEKAMKNTVDEVTLEVPEDPEVDVDDDGKTIIYKGEKYRYNDEVATILFIGTDRTVSQQENSETHIGANGQADTIILGIIDNKSRKISFLSINRDTMAPVAEYTADDDFAGNKVMQLCLAYSYGANNEQSCERMATAVSNYLYGMPINAYCRLSYDGIPPLNDAVGGVTVKIPEDMVSVNPSWTEGTKVTLKGEEATTFVRWRNTKTVHTNELRMARQRQYLNAYMKQTLRQVRSEVSLPITLYSLAVSYMTTDITPPKIAYLSSKALEYGIGFDAIRTVPGESIDGEEHVEFYSDDKALFEIILDLFYNKV